MTTDYNSVQWVMRHAHRYPLLTAEQEITITRVIQEGVHLISIPDEDLSHEEREEKTKARKAIDKMMLHNLRLVVAISNKYPGADLPAGDLIQEGIVGLRTACMKYDPSKGYRFSTYAYWWIRQAITKCLYSARIVRLPIYVTEKINKIKKLSRDYMRVNNVVPSKEYLATQLNVELNKIDDLLGYYSKIGSLNAVCSNSDGQDTEILDLLDDKNAISPEQALQHEALSSSVATALDTLPRREREMLKHKLGFYGEPLSLQHIADIQNPPLSRERVRQCIHKALMQLRNNKRVVNSLKQFML